MTSKSQLRRNKKKAYKPCRIIWGCGCVDYPVGGKAKEKYSPRSCGVCHSHNYRPRMSKKQALEAHRINRLES
jgi:hypothetical protein